MNETFLQKLRQVRWGDLGHVFLFLLALLPARLLKKRRSHLWLICEYPNEAQDNAAAFYRYLRSEQGGVDAVYAVKRRSPAYSSVGGLGETVEYGSLRHWVYYLAAEANISSQKCGSPNAAVCYVLEVLLRVLKSRRVFLQHGVTMHDLPFLHRDRACFSLFCCAAPAEYEFVRDGFGYPPEEVVPVGFCRFDAYHSLETQNDLVFVMPTWRMWLERSRLTEEQFRQSEYCRRWSGVLNNERLERLLETYGKTLVFCAHRNMEAYAGCFVPGRGRVGVLRWDELDLPALLRSAGTLITDYSSVHMDFGYMRKPVVYYQFDRAEFLQKHLPQGYFDFERDGFGPVAGDVDSLCRELESIWRDGCAVPEAYRRRAEDFFVFWDDKNCRRTYEAIRQMLDRAPERPETERKGVPV